MATLTDTTSTAALRDGDRAADEQRQVVAQVFDLGHERRKRMAPLAPVDLAPAPDPSITLIMAILWEMKPAQIKRIYKNTMSRPWEGWPLKSEAPNEACRLLNVIIGIERP